MTEMFLITPFKRVTANLERGFKAIFLFWMENVLKALNGKQIQIKSKEYHFQLRLVAHFRYVVQNMMIMDRFQSGDQVSVNAFLG
jgi:hypothetical protein